MSSSSENGQAHPPPTIVLALGNPQRGDDGAGPAVLERLGAAGVPAEVELIDGGLAGLETTLHLQHRRRAIILDAADFGAAPGTWRRVRLDDVSLASPEWAPGLHAAGLREALLLGEALGILPPEVILYLIQPGPLGWDSALSDELRACLEPVAQAVASELRGGGPPSAHS
jgi:hydrogenase maturation protease